ncbi:unnamed protein product [Mesocestoides corti]|uniref:PUM-HD domain-containing protein n=1 Tax=Mesocestoides corti TaxID=53468 RepID=A0A158QVC4_MESCO|nr:unnamed protein product [Mesocestoides corti]
MHRPVPLFSVLFHGVFTKKERREARLKAKKHADVVPTLLADWEVLRRDETAAEKKYDLVEKMLVATKGKLVDLCRARDTSRIVESMIQLGTEAQRWSIFAELKDRLRYLAMSQYAKHVVLKLINYGAKEHRLELFKIFRGHVAKMLRHKHAAEVIELLYNDYATAAQRALILQETYGHQHALQLTANNVQRLEEALDLNPDKRQIILANLNDLLVTMVSKGLMRLSIVQHLLLEYLTVMLKSTDLLKLQTVSTPKTTTKLVLGENEDNEVEEEEKEAAKQAEASEGPRREDRLEVLVETLLEAGIVSMLHTREGVKAALAVLWICPPKDRKTLLKSLKTCIVSTAENEHGHIFLMGLLDAVDDTKLLAKTVIKELLDDLEDVVAHPHARKVILYALAPRDRRHFAPALLDALIAPGDESPFTKKPLAVRALELRAPLVGLMPELLRLAASDEHLIPLFVGNAENPAPLEDRSRIVLLAEILIRSSVYELELSNAMSQFRRTGSKEEDRLSVARDKTAPIFTAADLEELARLREAALRKFVTAVLAGPDFKPVGLKPLSRDSVASAEARRHLQAQRRKRALAIAESEGIKKRKVVSLWRNRDLQLRESSCSASFSRFGEINKGIVRFDVSTDLFQTVKAFENTEEEEEGAANEACPEPMDTSATSEGGLPVDAPFLERPEGQLLVSRILQSEKKSDSRKLLTLHPFSLQCELLYVFVPCGVSCAGGKYARAVSPYDFGRLICELVPEQTMQAWLTCNRSCFVLVKLYELGNASICKQLEEVLSKRHDLITVSPLPGAKVLAKHLNLK